MVENFKELSKDQMVAIEGGVTPGPPVTLAATEAIYDAAVDYLEFVENAYTWAYWLLVIDARD